MGSDGSNSWSSRRCVPPQTTLRHAKQLAPQAGIAEVSEITRLDRLEVPVFVSVRPQARADCFTYGKGLRPVDAEVAAYMEAIEFHFAEPGSSGVTTLWATARDVAGAESEDDAILAFAPLFQKEIDLAAPLLLASADDLESGAAGFVPAELVFYPAPDVGQSIFGASTNGLASGNSVLEATIQALSELIERDIWSFEFVRATSRLIDPESLPDAAREIVDRAERNRLRLKIRAIPNEYGIPFFAAFLFDPGNLSRKFFNGGWGCDLDPRSALIKAVSEAAQSRVAFLHGGRGEPARSSAMFSPATAQEEADLVEKHIRSVSEAGSAMSFAEIPDLSVEGSLQDQLEALIERLRRVSRKPVYRAVFTPADSPLQVVRLVAPGLESFKETRMRVGRRLKSAIDAAQSSLRS